MLGCSDLEDVLVLPWTQACEEITTFQVIIWTLMATLRHNLG